MIAGQSAVAAGVAACARVDTFTGLPPAAPVQPVARATWIREYPLPDSSTDAIEYEPDTVSSVGTPVSSARDTFVPNDSASPAPPTHAISTFPAALRDSTESAGVPVEPP